MLFNIQAEIIIIMHVSLRDAYQQQLLCVICTHLHPSECLKLFHMVGSQQVNGHQIICGFIKNA